MSCIKSLVFLSFLWVIAVYVFGSAVLEENRGSTYHTPKSTVCFFFTCKATSFGAFAQLATMADTFAIIGTTSAYR